MKRIFAIVLALVMVLSLAACGGKDDTPATRPDENPTVNENPTETPTEPVEDGLKSEVFTIPADTATVESTMTVNQKLPDAAAMGYLMALATNQHAAAISFMNINGSKMVTPKDVEFNIPRGDYANIATHAGKNCYILINADDVTLDGTNAVVLVYLMDENDTELANYTFNMTMDANNNWVVLDNSFAVQNFSISVPGDVTVYIDDVEVNKDTYFVEKTGDNKMNDLYNFEYIGKSIKKIKIVGVDWETEVEHTPTTNTGDPLKIGKEIKDEELVKALDELKLLWNNMYTDYTNDVPESELLAKYFSKKAAADAASTVVKKFNTLTEKEKDHVMAEILPHEDKDSYYLTADTMELQFKYKITYIDGKRESNQRQYGHIWLVIEDGAYKIAKITDENMFDPAFINQW